MDTGAMMLEVGSRSWCVRLGDRPDLRYGDRIEILLGDLGWVPVRVERNDLLGWIGVARQGTRDNPAQEIIPLRVGMRARRVG